MYPCYIHRRLAQHIGILCVNMFRLDLFQTTKREPLCLPLSGPPPGPTPCRPALLLGLPSYVADELSQLLANDLIYASNSRLLTSISPELTDGLWLQILDFLPGSDLLVLTETVGGTRYVADEDVYSAGTDQVDQVMLQRLASQGPYQAIVVDDSSFVYESLIRDFVVQQYRQHDTSVIYMALEGIFDLSALQQSFEVTWRLREYTRRTIMLTAAGQRILTNKAFPCQTQYTKANYVVTSNHAEDDVLFAEYINPADYQYDGDDSDVEDDPVPEPSPGSPVVVRVRGNKSVAYCGFVNSCAVSDGAI